jgi:hypothetical protein
MPHIQTDNQLVTQITVIEREPGKQAEALSLMTERALSFPKIISGRIGYVARPRWE